MVPYEGDGHGTVTRVAPLDVGAVGRDLPRRGQTGEVPAVPIPEAHRRAAALCEMLFVSVPMTDEEKNFPDPDYGL